MTRITTRAELLELLTVERFAPYQPPARPRRRTRAGHAATVVFLDSPAVTEARRDALLHATRHHDDVTDDETAERTA